MEDNVVQNAHIKYYYICGPIASQLYSSHALRQFLSWNAALAGEGTSAMSMKSAILLEVYDCEFFSECSKPSKIIINMVYIFRIKKLWLSS